MGWGTGFMYIYENSFGGGINISFCKFIFNIANMKKIITNHQSLGLLLFLALFSAAAQAIIGIPDDKRFIDCEELHSKEYSSDYYSFEPKPSGKIFVHVCYDNTHEEWVVIKAAQGRTLEYLKNESLFFRLTSEIPAAIKQYETFIINDWRYEVLEYCPSGDLYQHVEDRGKLPEEEARFWFRQVAEVLAELHERKIVHLDIKLENFFLNRRVLKIGDFGFAEHLESSLPTYKKKGTCCAMAPEVLNKIPEEKYDPYAADVFSAGTVLFSLIAGGHPFQKAHRLDPCYAYMLKNKVKGLLEFYKIHPGLSPELIDLLENMLSANANTRPTMIEVLKHPWFNGPSFLSRAATFIP